MTCNQLMVLLDLYRGTFSPGRHMGTVEQDLALLVKCGLISRLADDQYQINELGNEKVIDILDLPWLGG